MDLLSALQYAKQGATLLYGAKNIADAYKAGDDAKLHESVEQIRPMLVDAAGVAAGSIFENKMNNRIAGGVGSAITGVAIDTIASVASEKPYGINKNMKENDYLMAVAGPLADFGCGFSVNVKKDKGKKGKGSPEGREGKDENEEKSKKGKGLPEGRKGKDENKEKSKKGKGTSEGREGKDENKEKSKKGKGTAKGRKKDDDCDEGNMTVKEMSI